MGIILTMMKNKERARQIKALMILKGLTNVELAKRIQVSKTWISLVIWGHAKSERVRRRIAEELGVSYEELWG